MIEWLKENVINLLVFLGSFFGFVLLVYRKFILLETRVDYLETRTVSFEASIKEELKEIKEDIKKLLAR